MKPCWFCTLRKQCMHFEMHLLVQRLNVWSGFQNFVFCRGMIYCRYHQILFRLLSQRMNLQCFKIRGIADLSKQKNLKKMFYSNLACILRASCVHIMWSEIFMKNFLYMLYNFLIKTKLRQKQIKKFKIILK